jgi:nucleoside-diphosphate-sugar epimerase
MARALITGAGGFIGRRLVQALVDRQTQVVFLDRIAPVTDRMCRSGVEYVVGDVRELDSVDRAMRDVHQVFHLAAATAPRTMAESRAIKVEGTRCGAAVAARQPHPPVFVYVSSLAATGPSDTVVDETSPCQPVSYYGRAKREAEQVLATIADRLSITVVRPSCVFGRGDRNLLRLYRLIRHGWEFHAHPSYRYSFVHVDDLVDGLIAAASIGRRLLPATDGAQAGVYLLADPQPVTFPELSAMIAHCLGVSRLRYVRVPHAVAWLTGMMGEFIQVATHRQVYMNRDKVREAYAGSWMCDPTRARNEWGWAPAGSLAERLAQTCAHFREDGWI